MRTCVHLGLPPEAWVISSRTPFAGPEEEARRRKNRGGDSSSDDGGEHEEDGEIFLRTRQTLDARDDAFCASVLGNHPGDYREGVCSVFSVKGAALNETTGIVETVMHHLSGACAPPPPLEQYGTDDWWIDV